MKIEVSYLEVSYQKGLYHFIWIKGIVELIMAFFLLYALMFGTQYKIITFLMILTLMFFGVKDLQYFLRLKDSMQGRRR